MNKLTMTLASTLVISACSGGGAESPVPVEPVTSTPVTTPAVDPKTVAKDELFELMGTTPKTSSYPRVMTSTTFPKIQVTRSLQRRSH